MIFANFSYEVSKKLLAQMENITNFYDKMNSSISANNESKNVTKNVCPTQEITLFPLRAKNQFGRWKIIVNVGSMFTQRVVATNCRYVSLSLNHYHECHECCKQGINKINKY